MFRLNSRPSNSTRKKAAFTQVATLAIVVAACLISLTLLAGCSSKPADEKVELEVYAANSLTDAMSEAQEAYMKAYPEVAFKDSQFEGSGTLVQKMETGGTPDIFISASKKNMNTVVEDDFVAEDEVFDLFENDLVIVTAEDSDIANLTLEQACDGAYTIAVGDKNVPAGTYAKQALYTVGCYTNESGSDGEIVGPIKGKVTEADKAGAVCSYAQSGEVDLGFAYSSDVMRYEGIKTVCVVDAAAHQPILYPAAVTKSSQHTDAAKAFLDWCKEDPEAQKIWQKWGFELMINENVSQESIVPEGKVEISTEGTAAHIEGSGFTLADFSRLEKGSERNIDGVYRGYWWLMDEPIDSLCVIDLGLTVVVYIPEAMLVRNDLDLNDAQTQLELRRLITALDEYSASGNLAISGFATWYFTSEKDYTLSGVNFAFAQEYKPGYFYTAITNPLALHNNPLPMQSASHIDFASIQPADEVAIAPEPSTLDSLGPFFATLDWSPLWVTLKTTGTALIFIFVLGLLAAWWAMRLTPRAQSIVDAILTIPLVLPPTVCGFLLLLCLGRNAPIGAWFDSVGFPLVFSWHATVIAAFVVAFPLMYRSARGAFEGIDTDMLDAARTLGWGEARIFFKLMLPLAWSSIAAGTMLAFARALGEFGATLFLAGNYAGITRTIPIAIYFEWMGGNIEAAIFWTIVVIIISFAVVFAINLWSKRTTKYRRREVAS